MRPLLLLLALAAPAVAAPVPPDLRTPTAPAPRPKFQPSDVLVARFLAFTPVGGGTPDMTPEVRAALVWLAQQEEWIAPGEAYFTAPGLDEAHLNYIRAARAELDPLPRLADVHMRPHPELSAEMVRQNRKYRERLEVRLRWETDRAPLIKVVIQETDELFAVWDAAADAANERYHVSYRRKCLGRLKTLLGPDLYHAGWMPPSIPVWRLP